MAATDDSQGERGLPGRLLGVAEAAAWLGLAVLLLRVVPFRKLFRELPPGGDGVPVGPELLSVVRRVRGDVGAIADRLPFPPTCLPRAFAGQLMCRVRGIRIPIALSVVANPARFSAHACLLPGSDEECAALTPDGRTHLGRIEFAWI